MNNAAAPSGQVTPAQRVVLVLLVKAHTRGVALTASQRRSADVLIARGMAEVRGGRHYALDPARHYLAYH